MVYPMCDWTDSIECCARVLSTRYDELSVKNQPPPYNSNVHGPAGCDTPISGLNAQRFVPMLTSLSSKYWPVGTLSVRLAPTVVEGVRRTNSGKAIARPPNKFTANRTRASAIPARSTDLAASAMRPLTFPHAYGRPTPRLAVRPKSGNVPPAPSVPMYSLALTSVIGLVGSSTTLPVE